MLAPCIADLPLDLREGRGRPKENGKEAREDGIVEEGEAGEWNGQRERNLSQKP